MTISRPPSRRETPPNRETARRVGTGSEGPPDHTSSPRVSGAPVGSGSLTLPSSRQLECPHHRPAAAAVRRCPPALLWVETCREYPHPSAGRIVPSKQPHLLRPALATVRGGDHLLQSLGAQVAGNLLQLRGDGTCDRDAELRPGQVDQGGLDVAARELGQQRVKLLA